MEIEHRVMPRARSTALGAVLALAMSSPAAGSETGHREHAAHMHGNGVLEVVADGDELVLALRVPAVNVVGFEHEPTSAEQRGAVQDAIARFSAGATLFIPSVPARCEFEHAEVSLGAMSNAAPDGGHDHDAKHDHDEKHADGAGDGHSELHAEYHFHCETPGKLTAVEVRVFEQLDHVEAIDARVVTARHQGAAELTPQRRTLTLGP